MINIVTLDIMLISILKDNYVWVLVNKDNHSVIIVDPGEAAPVIHFLNDHQLDLKAILITHHHWDHTNGIEEILKFKKVPVYGSATEQISYLTHPLRELDIIDIPEFPLRFQVLAIPGHTAGHIAYYSPGMLFCGDTLFGAGCGRLFEGTAEQMFVSLQKLAALPDDTKVYCGHEYTLNNLRFAAMVEPHNQQIMTRVQNVTELREKNLPSLPSTMKEEKETNPFLRCDVLEIKRSLEKQMDRKLESAVDVFAMLRKSKDEFK